MKIGIDKIAFYVPNQYLDMTDLALARDVDPDKFHIGLGQDEMAVTLNSEDIISLAANAADDMLDEQDRQEIDMVIVGTESIIDESKAAAVVLHRLLKVQSFARSFEIKEACFGATAGLIMARNHIEAHPKSKVLILAADIARYGLNSAGEPTQGAGAVAMLISASPRILSLKKDNLALTQDIYDFWRPTAESFPRVDGKLSNETYIGSFAQIWQEYKKRTGLDFKDFAALTFHTPYTKMGKKALLPLTEDSNIFEQYEKATIYNRRVGNIYAGSLYLNLISLLENSSSLKVGDRIGLFSYGSGAVAEFFSGELEEAYKENLRPKQHQSMLNRRKKLTIQEYEDIFKSQEISLSTQKFSLKEIKDGVRIYQE
ncbi:MAG: hydroxymethylglutaryl-CoA synthase [Lactovum sp.]